MTNIHAKVLVVGGGVGGVAAALTAARRGLHVVLSEPTRWIGGVLTSQAVPPDEHRWIEQFGCTATYRQLRADIRDYYRRHYPLTDTARADRYLNPGAAKVSDLCHEPRVTLAVLEALLAPHRASGRVEVRLEHAPVSAEVDQDAIQAVTLEHLPTGDLVTIAADWVVDATETGDLLPMAGVEYVTGAESVETTGEPHAPSVPAPLNMQPVSVCFAVDHRPGEDHRIDKPALYQHFADARIEHWPGSQLSFEAPHPKLLTPVQHFFDPNPDGDHTAIRPDYADERVGSMDKNLWTFRRIAARQNFRPGAYPSDITLVNWPQVDYWEGPVIEAPDGARHAERARHLSLSFLYWLQTEAPRPDGGTGWPGLKLRGDLLGDSPDGLALAPYIRESRRIVAEHTITEQEIALEVRGNHGAAEHRDSIGIGMYRIDLHPSTGGDPYIDIPCLPFQVPLGGLLPVRVRNLLPAAKNIGTTHITNGAYRMPLVEWNVGEVDAHLIAYCEEHGCTPSQVRAKDDLLADFQSELTASGVELAWPRVAGY
ncbi:FAD-dependent oxidoreductase [Ruania alkalisoli]|uniref:FAD-dependent oxidoreductase n=1 Tax=Ruania alkalisoli TaxID=2779775 RepID=A0A7M1SP87_9MICO|nr:FAD-dependent oxidoreductase [Ruania alkalisoli]QOR69370.1 FAD-dependent oxidoreductase [Ruania alkalisoli]